MRTFRFSIVITALTGSSSETPTLSGQSAHESEAAKQTVDDRLESLDQKVRILERRLELEKEGEDARAKEAPILGAGKDGFFLKSKDGSFQLKLRGYVHADGRFFFEDDEKPNANTFLLRRARPIFEGTLFKIFDFRIMPDFGEGKTVLQDTYLDARFLLELKLQVGKFKTPFRIEHLQSATDIRFIERGLPNNLIPNRDVGTQLHGDLLGEVVSYAIGVFNGVPDGGSGDIETHDE